ncbi:MAG: Rieske (2Fe-2S) protein [Ignavibacteriaceae bacterium]
MNPDLENFTFSCHLSDIPSDKGMKVIIDDEEVALFKVKNRVYALSNLCPHQHRAIIFDGFIEDEFVVCPAHGWKFSLKDGMQPDNRKGLRSFETKIVESSVYVKITKSSFNW